MKIALIIEHFDAARGGAEQYAVWLAGQLAQAGHEVHVLCHDRGRFFAKYSEAKRRASHEVEHAAEPYTPPLETHPGLTAVHVHRFPTMKLSTALGFCRFGQAARRWCAAHRPDVAHSMTVAWPGDLYHPHAGLYARLQGQAVASRETAAAARWKRWMLRLSRKQRALLNLERRATGPTGPWKILCVSPLLQRDFQEVYAAPPQRLILLENPRMTPVPIGGQVLQARRWFRRMYRLDDTARVALFVGHDFRRKGLAWAIRVIAATPVPWTLIVVGLGRARRYMELAQQLVVADRIKFIGPTQCMAEVYSAADALLLPTFYDSFGLVALEAVGWGLPVISTRFLGVGELLQRHGLGTIVESPRAVQAMAAALAAIDPRTVDRAAAAQHAAAATAHLTPSVYLAKLTELYRQCALAQHQRAR